VLTGVPAHSRLRIGEREHSFFDEQIKIRTLNPSVPQLVYQISNLSDGKRVEIFNSPRGITDRDIVEPTRRLGIQQGVQESERGKSLLEPPVIEQRNEPCTSF
jgi:hypothetical protein